MEYFKMGSVINNRHIRNAFEAAGYNVGNLDCSDELCLYYGKPNGAIVCTHHPAKQQEIINNPNYQELTL
jgi:hypothetical protein